ncbi:MAG TPA: iron-sulfur cluster assembly scaffold protein [Anaerolineae bacterium]|nr:iron-sulfur cluster assembly scaffold protein [Anaerolineae bacterium]
MEEQVHYSAKVIEEAAHPKNVGRMPESDAWGIIRGCCGDTMEVYLRLDGERIREATFVTDGHESAIACGSMLTTMVRGMTLEEAGAIEPEDLIRALDGLPASKRHCAKLTVNTLREAISNSRARSAP